MADFGSTGPEPARLAVGLISAGRVGTAVGHALERRSHVVSAVVARSDRSRALADARLQDVSTGTAQEVARASELVVLAVPDSVLPGLVRELADAGAITSRHIIVHTAGAMGCDVLAPAAGLGAVVIAAHPAMTFTGSPADLDRLDGCTWAVTAGDDVALAVGQMLVMETGGLPVTIDEGDRGLYHAALAHGSNHLVTLVNDALQAVRTILHPHRDGGVTVDPDGLLSDDPDALAERLLGPLLRAALDNALESGDAALTGPVMRGDAVTVARHLDVLEAHDDDVAAGYRALALRTAQRSGAGAVMKDLLAPDLEEARR